jgi:nucleoid-associated protein YgaU
VNYPLQAMIQMGVVPPVTFPTDSRYYGFGVLQYTAANGQTIPYLARRIVPQPGAPNFATINQYTVRQGDRLDLIAAKYLGDPLMFWLICDANGAIRPGDLVATVGEVLAITTPQGIPGGMSAR